LLRYRKLYQTSRSGVAAVFSLFFTAARSTLERLHDDWKTTDHWMAAQSRYMRRELDKISQRPSGLRDWLRFRPPLMPLAAFLYCLFWKGLILDGRAGLFYALQRLVAEACLALMVLEASLKTKSEPGGES
jgi:hypothetical protein